MTEDRDRGRVKTCPQITRPQNSPLVSTAAAQRQRARHARDRTGEAVLSVAVPTPCRNGCGGRVYDAVVLDKS